MTETVPVPQPGDLPQAETASAEQPQAETASAEQPQADFAALSVDQQLAALKAGLDAHSSQIDKIAAAVADLGGADDERLRDGLSRLFEHIFGEVF